MYLIFGPNCHLMLVATRSARSTRTWWQQRRRPSPPTTTTDLSKSGRTWIAVQPMLCTSCSVQRTQPVCRVTSRTTVDDNRKIWHNPFVGVYNLFATPPPLHILTRLTPRGPWVVLETLPLVLGTIKAPSSPLLIAGPGQVSTRGSHHRTNTGRDQPDLTTELPANKEKYTLFVSKMYCGVVLWAI